MSTYKIIGGGAGKSSTHLNLKLNSLGAVWGGREGGGGVFNLGPGGD